MCQNEVSYLMSKIALKLNKQETVSWKILLAVQKLLTEDHSSQLIKVWTTLKNMVRLSIHQTVSIACVCAKDLSDRNTQLAE